MKPLALRLQAFGSYAGEFVIDFARLGRHGVFSIAGPTGAGKSTIFDAIVYALYDDLPGFRVNSHIRSQYADPGTRTEVTLEFEAEGRHWVLTRIPAQSRPSCRATTGAVEDPSKVILAEAGDRCSTLTRKREVSERISELVGLDKAQFEQVVLIPQGKFEEVLKAKTQDRADLLAKLFPVDVFVRTTEALRQLAADRRQAHETLTQGRRALEDRVLTALAGFRAEARHPDLDSDAGHDTATGGYRDGSDAAPPDSRNDLECLAEVREEFAADLASVVSDRNAAERVLDDARTHRIALEEGLERWRQWRSDVDEARHHPDEEAADLRIALDLDRAGKVAILAGARRAWRTAEARLAELGGMRTGLETVVDVAWIDTYDSHALKDAMSCHVLASVVTERVRELEAAEIEFSDLQRHGDELTEAEHDLAERQAALTAAVSALEFDLERAAACEAALRDATDRAASRPEAAARFAECEVDALAAHDRRIAERNLEDLTTDFAARAPAVAEATARATALRAAWRSGLAGRLAADLPHGAPCPTCGATEHPLLAAATTDVPTDAELDAAEEVARRRVEEQHARALRVAEARAAVEVRPPVAGTAEIEVRLAELRAELDALDQSVQERLRQTVELETLRCRVAKAQTTTAEARTAVAALTGALAERRTRWERDRDSFAFTHGIFAPTTASAAAHRTLAAAVHELAGNLEATEAAEAARGEQLTALDATMAELGVDDPAGLERWAMAPTEIEELREQLTLRAGRRQELRLRIGTYTDGGGPREEPDAAPARSAEQSAVSAYQDLVGRAASLTRRLIEIDALAVDLADDGAIVGARLAKEEADTLAGLCAGSGTGPDANRLSLKNWVLAYYLRQVLAHANHRLSTMTNGRYALDLSGDHDDARRPWGLDIAVRDAETGQTRPATTLSGGETFMAALSLALGLADVVSAGSNYSIGALFIDEGFGSLDGDSLDTVIDVLRSLQDGGRMVGVISHVQELKDALPTGITVAPTTSGSIATLNYPDV